MTGERTLPVVGHGYVAWNQPISAASADLKIYRFSQHSLTTLDSGRLSSPVFASNYLVWAKYMGDDSQPSSRFADANTLQLTTGPAELGKPNPVTYLAGSSEYLLWIAINSSASSTSSVMAVDELGTGRVTHYTSDSHYLQFPTLAGHYLVWFAATVDAVADLHTGAGSDIPLPGGVTATGDAIVVAKLAPGVKGRCNEHNNLGIASVCFGKHCDLRRLIIHFVTWFIAAVLCLRLRLPAFRCWPAHAQAGR